MDKYHSMVKAQRTWPGAAFLFLLLLAGACSSGEKKPSPATASNQPPKAMPVEAMIVSPRSLEADIEVPGTILANEATEIHPEVSGRITELHIREGQFVSAGFILAKLYDADLQARMRKLEVQLQIAEQTEKRQGELLKIQGISQQDYDLSLLNVKNIRADMDILKEDIRKTELRAPFSGKLGLKNVSPGAYVTPSTVLTTISQVDQLKLQFNVPERYSTQMKSGLAVNFTIDGTPGIFTASVMATQTDIEEDTRSLAVRALVKGKTTALVPGAFAKVRLTLGKDNQALMVPNTVIVPTGRKKQLFTYKAGQVVVADVSTGVRDSVNVQILQGLKAGDTVITSAVLFLRPGMDVQIAKLR